jgi:hypothetical protein
MLRLGRGLAGGRYGWYRGDDEGLVVVCGGVLRVVMCLRVLLSFSAGVALAFPIYCQNADVHTASSPIQSRSCCKEYRGVSPDPNLIARHEHQLC